MLRTVLGSIALAALVSGCPQDVKPLDGNKDAAVSDAGDVDGGAGPADAGGPRCGNQSIDLGEACDGDLLGGASCDSIGLGTGDLACASDCSGFDLSGCESCTPTCGVRVCGLEPTCNSSCGTCMASEACTEDGRCLPSCEFGDVVCTGDGTGFTACGPNDALGISDFGPRVACAGGGACSATATDPHPCDRTACAPTDVMLLMDRSSRIAFDSAWSWTREAIGARFARHEHAGRFGLIQFPHDACAPGPPLSLAGSAAQAIDQRMMAPGADASTPLAASLTAVASEFVPGVDAQAVLLLTAGDESCADPEDAVIAAARLFRSGVRVYAVGITAQANPALLDRIAIAGGTRMAYAAATRTELDAALDAIFAELGACENRFATVATGYYHACRLRTDGAIDCWGRTQDERLVPPAGAHRHLAAGTDNACAVGEDDQVRCWGRDHRLQSQPPAGAFSQVAGGDSHFCGLRLDGSLACWGYDDAGQASPPAGTYKQVTAGSFHGCAIRMDDTVVCWGNRPAPSGAYRQIDGGGFGTCGVHLDGTLECTGGDPPPTGTFVKVAKGPDHACAIATDGTLACWGRNHVLQSEPPAGQFVDVDVDNEYGCATRATGAVECWGNGSNGQTTPPP